MSEHPRITAEESAMRALIARANNAATAADMAQRRRSGDMPRIGMRELLWTDLPRVRDDSACAQLEAWASARGTTASLIAPAIGVLAEQSS